MIQFRLGKAVPVCFCDVCALWRVLVYLGDPSSGPCVLYADGLTCIAAKLLVEAGANPLQRWRLDKLNAAARQALSDTPMLPLSHVPFHLTASLP